MPTFKKKSLIILAAKDISQNRRVPSLAGFFAKSGYDVHVFAFTPPNPRLSFPSVTFHTPPTVTIYDRVLKWLSDTELKTDDMFRPRFSGSRLLGYMIGAVEFLKFQLRGPLTWLVLTKYGHKLAPDQIDSYRKDKRYAEVLQRVFSSSIADRRRQKFHAHARTHLQGMIDSTSILLCHDRFSAELVSDFSGFCDTTIFDIVELIRYRTRESLETRSHYQLEEIQAAEALLNTSVLLTVSDAISDQLNLKSPFLTFLNGRPREEFVSKMSKQHIIGFSGSFFPGCGLQRLIETMLYVPVTYRLLLVGSFSSPAYKADILKALRQRELETRVEIVEGLEVDMIPSHLTRAGLYVLPFHPEKPNLQVSMPNRLFDALSAGLPILSQHGLYLSDWLKQRGVGLITDFSKPITAAAQLAETLEGSAYDGLVKKVPATFEEACSENQLEELGAFLKRHISSF